MTVLETALQKNHEDAINAICFTITQDNVNDPIMKQKYKDWIGIVQNRRKDLQPYLIITKIDEINPALRTEPTVLDSMLDEKVDQISAEIGIPANNIFPTIGYIKEHENNFAVDKLICTILQDILGTAEESAAQ